MEFNAHVTDVGQSYGGGLGKIRDLKFYAYDWN